MHAKTPSAILLYPPLTDPTSPYHSLTYLASYARASGFPNVVIRDTNIEALAYCARADVLLRLKEDWARRHRELAAQPCLLPHEQIEYLHGFKAQALEPENIGRAVKSLQSFETFFHYPTYRDAVKQLKLWLDSLSCGAFPGQFGNDFNLSAERYFSLSSVADLSNKVILDRVVGPFREYYHQELFPSLKSEDYDLVGVNVTYIGQLPYALWLVREIRRLLPETYLVCGGTEVSGIWKYILNRDLFPKLFEGADACVIGEGETAFFRIMESVAAGSRPQALPNVVTLDRSTGTYAAPPSIAYEDLDSLPTPEYELLESDLYLSPRRLVYYSPTRGCYWNKCTFCDYGLNFGTPTSPWRQRSLELVARDLKAISRYTPYVYLSVDVLAPGSLLKLARAIVAANIKIKWAAEVRLEKYFNRERCEVLRQSGCVAVSVGFESGCQRILDKIQKATRLDDIETTIRNFTEAGIAVQMMGFTGFPTETYEEAMESVSYLKRNARYWTVAGLGDFQLTPGAIVAQRPSDFNLSEVQSLRGDDISRALIFSERGGPSKTPDQLLVIEKAKRELSSIEFDRPFAGGIDCAHSILYYDRYGLSFPQAFVHQDSGEPASPDINLPLTLNGKLVMHEQYNLLNFYDGERLKEIHIESRRKGTALDAHNITAELRKEDEAAFPVTMKNPIFLRRDGESIPCSYEMLNVIEQVNGTHSPEAILDILAPAQDDSRTIYQLVIDTLIALELVVPTRSDKTSNIIEDVSEMPVCGKVERLPSNVSA